MGIFSKLFGGKTEPEMEGMDEHLVRVHIPITDATQDLDRYSPLEDLLAEAVERTGVGMLDGNEIGEGEYTIWLYGAQADLLAQVVRKTLAGHDLPAGASLFLRHGGVGDKEALEEVWPLGAG